MTPQPGVVVNRSHQLQVPHHRQHDQRQIRPLHLGHLRPWRSGLRPKERQYGAKRYAPMNARDKMPFKVTPIFYKLQRYDEASAAPVNAGAPAAAPATAPLGLCARQFAAHAATGANQQHGNSAGSAAWRIQRLRRISSRQWSILPSSKIRSMNSQPARSPARRSNFRAPAQDQDLQTLRRIQDYGCFFWLLPVRRSIS